MSERNLLLFRVHQRDAALDARERAAQRLEGLALGRDRFVISSCHRVEVYALAGGRNDPELAALFPPPLSGDEPVARHLFRVACGLDSVVVGERQILGQLRRTHDAVRRRGALSADLSELVRRALHLGRRIRALGLLQTGRSIGSLAVDAVAARVENIEQRTVLVIGAGEMGSLAARALATRAGRVLIANRDSDRAHSLAIRIGAVAVPLAELDDALTRADAVVSAADTRGTLLTRDRLERRLEQRPLLLVDIAVPRSVADDAREFAGMTYLTVDDLPAVPRDGGTVGAVEDLCRAEAVSYLVWRREREAAGAIRTLRERADAMRRARLQRTLAKLRHLDERDRRIVEALSAALVNELLHGPTVALRREPARTEAVLRLFGGEP